VTRAHRNKLLREIGRSLVHRELRDLVVGSDADVSGNEATSGGEEAIDRAGRRARADVAAASWARGFFNTRARGS
jgi:hypothetical protein